MEHKTFFLGGGGGERDKFCAVKGVMCGMGKKIIFVYKKL